MHRPEVTQKLRENRAKRVFPFENTNIELALQDELRSRKIEFTTHKSICGQPDLFITPNICIFADGDYWHSNPNIYDETHRIRYGSKVLSQKEIHMKDKKVTETLEGLGYKVFRFWVQRLRSPQKTV